MVVVELPLWVVHTNATPAAAAVRPSASSAAAASSKSSKASSNSSENGNGDAELTNASLALLETFGVKKAAIYSVDVHPMGHKFATAGGDGMVRIWSTGALFAKNRGAFAAKGNNNDKDSKEGEDITKSKSLTSTVSTMSSSRKATTYISSESSAPENNDATGDEEDEPKNLHKDDQLSSSGTAVSPSIHDLNSLVRRKRDGTHVSVKQQARKKPETSSAAAKSTTEESRDKHHGKKRLLCTLSPHSGTSVMAVRFSKSGRYLASAGDDGVVCIYTLLAGATSSPASSAFGMTENLEQWSRVKLCRGHGMDVVDLAWAPDDSHLVSCSLDKETPIIVWKLTDLVMQYQPDQHSSDQHHYHHGSSSRNVLCNPYKILGKDIHTSFVKGVTFDPAGTYLASSGDDPAICIWRAHDDWGLERKLDDTSGIFRQWGSLESLSSQTLFRRLDWSTDGTYICSTNATVKNKNVASTISREGWGVSAGDNPASSAANLVGHKQPVMVCRHCPHLLDQRTTEQRQQQREGDPADYSCLLALGDKRGFVTVWSTRKSRPLFKLQCSESRCMVTDISWGFMGKSLMILLVTLLDGHMTAMRFRVPDELGMVLTDHDQKRVFQLRYGIDMEDDDIIGRRRLFVGDNSVPKLIENPLQMSMEAQGQEIDEEDGGNDAMEVDDEEQQQEKQPQRQVETTTASGKKRVRPMLMSVEKPNGESSKSIANGKAKEKKQKSDPSTAALEAAAKATSAVETVRAQQPKAKPSSSVAKTTGKGSSSVRLESPSRAKQQSDGAKSPSPTQTTAMSQQQAVAHIPHSTSRVHSADLPMDGDDEPLDRAVVNCSNIVKIPKNSSGNPIPCAVLTIVKQGQPEWKDELVGTTCTALSATKSLLAVGTADGSIYLYGAASASTGWKACTAARSHPPLIMSHAVVSMELMERQTSNANGSSKALLELLIVTSDGFFGLYQFAPEQELILKGSVMPPMTHMALAATNGGGTNSTQVLPKMARIQLTEHGRLLMLLSMVPTNAARESGGAFRCGAGGSLQAFVYDQKLELWTRVGDSRFLLSDFYSILPAAKTSGKKGVVASIERSVRCGSSNSTLKAKRRTYDAASSMYGKQGAGDGSSLATRAHCEDRIACAVALKSPEEFKFWLIRYVRTLSASGYVDQLRLLVDMIIGNDEGSGIAAAGACWWLASATQILGFDRKTLVKKVVLPEMSKNRALQRVTNEIALEVGLT